MTKVTRAEWLRLVSERALDNLRALADSGITWDQAWEMAQTSNLFRYHVVCG